MENLNIIELLKRMGIENPSTDERAGCFKVKFLAILDENRQDHLQILEFIGIPASINKELIKESKQLILSIIQLNHLF